MPVCLVAKELLSARTIRLWANDMKTPLPPYSVGADAIFVAFYASAEMACHLVLGWPLPEHVLDLYAEFRVETNGQTLPTGNGLLGALGYYGHQGISALEKDSMRELILRGGTYSADEQSAILDYCESDVIATEKLCTSMWPLISQQPRLGHALLRGRYTKAVARMESHGIPLDGDLLYQLRASWNDIQDQLISRIDADFGKYIPIQV